MTSNPARDTVQPEAPTKPKVGVLPQGQGGYDACWYPIVLSSEVGLGEVRSSLFLDGRVVVFRGEDGVAQVLSAFCRHLGADLAAGAVAGNELRCAFHHWKYDRTGVCTHHPAGDPIPSTARLFRFPTVERLGIIWAFNGHEPAYDAPHFSVAEDSLAYISSRVQTINQDHWILLSNSLDFQHLRFVHGLQFDAAPDKIRFGGFGHEYPMAFIDPKLGRMDQIIRVFGTNVITLSGNTAGVPNYSMSAFKAIPGNRSESFLVAATPKNAGPPDVIEQILAASDAFLKRLFEEDIPILDTLRFKQDHLTAADEALARYFGYIRDYPRAHPAREYIS
jgi:phenylpropionate dioxygenase-like ring-hydroxylating dioxygenase large terminal subunit